MLASLFRGNSGQRSSQYIDSVTDDAHTRSLLFGQSQNVFNLTISPPASPFGSPSLRPSSYDDQGGLEIEEKDVRVLLAQDAQGSDERPTILFDSRKITETDVTPSGSQPAMRSPLPSNWRSSQGSQDKAEDGMRNRSSTFSGTQSSWSKVNRDLTPKDDPFLECMFGAPSSAKTSSSTKMHIIPAKTRRINASERGARRSTEQTEPTQRTKLARAHTSGQTPTLTSIEPYSRDALLITRIFHIVLDENSKIVNTKSSTSKSENQDKRTKLVERKVPAFAIGFILQLPYPVQRPRSSHSRLALNSSYGQSFTSATSSCGSDMQSSWTFLDAIPASLSSSLTVSDDGDRRLDMILDNWDVILRGLSSFERVAVKVVDEQLQRALQQMSETPSKAPKEKSMQRINQRMVAIHDTGPISKLPLLISASADVSRRIVNAIRIPRVVTGLGFTAGHWTDEARMLYRTCGSKQQNFFLFNLLTAFLGNHMQWLERLAPEKYRKQFKASHKKLQELDTLASRTIIISEHKGLARRLIYVLASFLPGRGGIDSFQRAGGETSFSFSSSPSGHALRNQQPRRASKPHMREPFVADDPAAELLSTSASSRGSRASTFINRSPRKQLIRKDSNRFDIGGGGIRTTFEGGAGTSSAIVPQAAATPTAYISLRDTYFPEDAIVETNDSIASADLSKMLHRAASSHRRTSSVSSRLGSLVNGIWGARQSNPPERSSVTTVSPNASPVHRHNRSVSSALSVSQSGSNPLQMMVDELEQARGGSTGASLDPTMQNRSSSQSRRTKMTAAAPRMHVDDKDGVVDVELDLPGFLSATSLTPPQHQPAKSRFKALSFGPEGSESVCSLRSLVSKISSPCESGAINVGGYLRRHHEDFALHAVRPYTDLHEDIKRSMRSEPTPQETLDKILQEALPTCWVSICTTLIADTKTYSIHRLTLRRQYEVSSPDSAGSQSGATPSPSNSSTPILRNEETTDEMVMEFDTTLADAIERLLNNNSAEALRSHPSSRTHSRNVSAGSNNRGALPAVNEQRTAAQPHIRPETIKSDHRDLVVGALEDVIRSVNDGLNKTFQQRDHTNRLGHDRGSLRQENALREGVKRWMLDVEQTSVW